MKKYHFPACGCSIQIDESLPDVFGRPSLIYPDDPELLDPDCPTTYGMLSEGLTKGVWQLDSSLGRQYAKKLKPEKSDHLSALNALLRPGCLKVKTENGMSMTDLFCLRKNGLEPTTYIHESLEPLLRDTYGVLTYQEQAMAIAVSLAGFTPQQADDLRKAIGKKKTDIMAKVKGQFVDGAANTGIVDKEQAATIFGWIEKSQRYSFNKCISFDTKILRPNGGRYSNGADFTVEEMYRIRNDISYAKSTNHLSLHNKWKLHGNYGKGLSLHDDGRIRPNIIVDIQPAGKRSVYKITLENGATIRATDNHKFPTNKGQKTVREMIFDNTIESLFVCGEYEKTDNSRYGFSQLTKEDLLAKKEGKAVNNHFASTNYGYTNGSYADFIRFKLSTANVCFRCNVGNVRIETHHIDGDRTNSQASNLIKLCVSCHKKQEYTNGRVKRGEKGYPSILTRIISITPDEECMTYDVTMAAPNHTFVVDTGIVTCNSHAMSYALIGYHTAHLKAHFPPAFFNGWLWHAKNKQEPLIEIRELINEAKIMGIKVLPPRFEDLKYQFTTDGVVVTFGLSDIKEVKNRSIAKMRENAAIVEKAIGKVRMEWNWLDFLIDFSPTCSKTVVNRMISAGAMAKYPFDRQRMLAEYNIYRDLTEKEQNFVSRVKSVGHTDDNETEMFKRELDEEPESTPIESLLDGLKILLDTPKAIHDKRRREKVASYLKMLENPARSLIDTSEWIAKNEQECLGIPVTCSRVEGQKDVKADTTCQEYRAGKDEDVMVLAVDVQDFREIKIQNGKNIGRKMAFLTVADASGSLEDVCIFSEAWEKYGNMIFNGATVEISGNRDSNRGSFIVEEVYPL